ncbi:MAG: acylneuraminate cytidylyltransferase [Bacillales bacterium]|jgi:CMP-N-acetylneuraminic acid synthetase|nr:acylneuraminate cytidylyltransferase [Bacillales bacterium]
MINGKKILGLIPARGGSKGLPGKNIKDLGGKPLIAWTIEEAKKSKFIDRLILSSDDEKIIDTALQYKCDVPFIRPEELAGDETSGIDVVLHAINTVPDYDYVILLQPTSPFRTVDDIDNAIELLLKNDCDGIVSVCESKKPPFWSYYINDNYLIPIFNKQQIPVRRQDMVTYDLNGAIYIAKINTLIRIKSFLGENTIGYVMPQHRSVDIDTQLDFDYCSFLLHKNIV